MRQALRWRNASQFCERRAKPLRSGPWRWRERRIEGARNIRLFFSASPQAARDAKMVDGIATFDDVVRRLAQRIAQGTAAPSAVRLHAPQRRICALNDPPSSKASRTATSAAARLREIELLDHEH